MASLRYHLAPALQNAGDFISLDGVLPEDSLKMGHLVYDLPEGIPYHIDLSHAGDGIVASGTVCAPVIGACARCLEPARFQADGDIEGYFVFDDPGEDAEDLAPDEFDLVDAEGEIELADCIRAAVVFEIPTVLLCDEDCKGLCPHCGTNLNISTCDCADRPDDDSPFAALKGLDFSS